MRLVVAALLNAQLVAAYQLLPLRSNAPPRSAVVMEYTLNNYALPGPLSPLGNMVLVKLSKASDMTAGGLFVAAEATEKPREGTVVAAGPGFHHPESGVLMPCPVAAGDYVLLAEFSGEKVEYNGESHTFVNADQILGVFEAGMASASAFKPTGDRLLVSIAEAAKETASGIAITATEEEPTQGEVIAVGAGASDAQGNLLPMGLTAGDNVIYGQYAGADALLDGKTYKVVRSAECMAKW